MLTNYNRVISNIVYIISFFTILIIIINVCDWKLYALLSIVFLILSCLNLKLGYEIGFISYSTIFLVCFWIFHCGQIINYGFELDGKNYLFFINYGTEKASGDAFVFYVVSQFLITEAIGYSYNKIERNKSLGAKTIPVYLKYILFSIGFGPRVYYDLTYLIYTLRNGYSGSDIYFPQFINTLAFFADVAIMIELITCRNRKRETIIFAIVILYKGIMMMSGHRQEAFVFIIVFSYLYFFVNRHRPINVKKTLYYFLIGYVAVVFIMTVGELRTSEFKSISVLVNTLSKNIKGGFLANLFGEFGSAFTTLVKTVNDTPQMVNYGHGLSYVAGTCSVIPTVAGRIPMLANKTAYILQYQNVSSLGGSFLGEFYYNFGWFGLIGMPVVGMFLGKVQKRLELFRINRICDEDILSIVDDEINDNYIIGDARVNLDLVFSIIMAISLLLFIRGYFTDMVQKVVWTMIVVSFLSTVVVKKGVDYEKI